MKKNNCEKKYEKKTGNINFWLCDCPLSRALSFALYPLSLRMCVSVCLVKVNEICFCIKRPRHEQERTRVALHFAVLVVVFVAHSCFNLFLNAGISTAPSVPLSHFFSHCLNVTRRSFIHISDAHYAVVVIVAVTVAAISAASRFPISALSFSCPIWRLP